MMNFLGNYPKVALFIENTKSDTGESWPLGSKSTNTTYIEPEVCCYIRLFGSLNPTYTYIGLFGSL